MGRIARAFVTAVLVLVLVELVLRLFVAHPPVPWGPAPFRPLPHDGGLEMMAADLPVSLHDTDPVMYSWMRERLVARRKERGTFRIAVVGESAIYGFGLPITASPPWRLERLLQAHMPARRWEVLNLGSQGAPSTIHRDNLRAALAQASPDLVIIQTGNNEYLPLLAYRSVHPQYDARADSASRMFRRSWLYGSIYVWVTGWSPTPTVETEADAERMNHTTLMEGDEALVAEVYERNLIDMCEMCREAGVPVVLSTIPTDRCWSPSILNFEQLPAGVRKAVESARGKRADDRPKEALRVLRPLLEQYDNAQVHFEVGMCLRALGHGGEAREELDKAMVGDCHPRLALPWQQKLVVETGRRLGVAVCDVAAGFDATMPGGVPGEELFLDSCHPNSRGARLNAQLWLQTLTANNLLPLARDVSTPDPITPPSLALEDFPGHLELFASLEKRPRSKLSSAQRVALSPYHADVVEGGRFSLLLPPLDVGACTSVELLRLYGHMLCTDDAYDAALACYLRAVAVCPTPSADMYFDAGLAAMLGGRVKTAREMLARGLALNGRDSTMRRKLSVLRLIDAPGQTEPLPRVVPVKAHP